MLTVEALVVMKDVEPPKCSLLWIWSLPSQHSRCHSNSNSPRTT